MISEVKKKFSLHFITYFYVSKNIIKIIKTKQVSIISFICSFDLFI